MASDLIPDEPEESGMCAGRGNSDAKVRAGMPPVNNRHVRGPPAVTIELEVPVVTDAE